ncbi:hypothetical protein T01_5765 [Trichinella spiralis]|uniref:Uncharacterized protein n=1 Tax=Trichinella spiralis TaxID=6334 RepID=A0A0V1BFM8_TRISP|nr:hypothetical protein T01_5765 [Trichinella spiralis]
MSKTSVELCEKLNTCLKLCDFHMAYSHCSIVIMTLLAISREPESVCNEALYRLFLPLFNVLIVHTDGIQCLLGICGFSRWVNPFKQKLKYDGEKNSTVKLTPVLASKSVNEVD